MSSTAIHFKAKLLIGEQQVPLASEIAFGSDQSQDGIKNGFLFKLDRQPGDPPVTVFLGDVIDFIESKLGSSDLSQNSNLALLSQAFPNQSFTPANFNKSNQTMVNIYEFSINSGEDFLFSFNLDVEGSDPTKGLIALPGDLNNWVKINSLSISFSATSASKSSNQPTS